LFGTVDLRIQCVFRAQPPHWRVLIHLSSTTLSGFNLAHETLNYRTMPFRLQQIQSVNRMNLHRVLLATLLLCSPLVVHAQISWSGIYDFEIKKGGTGSSLGWNQLPNDYIQLNVQNLQLFVDASIDDGISLSAKIATNRQTASDPRYLDLELANVTFWHLAGNALNISAGKILTPFGAFTRRQLSPDNPLIGQPLFFYYQTNVSPQTGYLDAAAAAYAQSSYGGMLSTIYNGGYYVGADAFGSFANDLIEYNIALMNSPLSSPNTSINLDKDLAFHGRVAVHPAIWGTLGFSYCTGSFLEHNSVNSFYDALGGLGSFKQNTAGIDVTLSYLFYEINAEYIHNDYDAPYVVYDTSGYGWYRSGLPGNGSLTLSSDEVLVDVKIDLPFYPGLYVAGRYNTLSFGKIIDPYYLSSTYGQSISWDDDVQKYALGVGYKPAHGVLIKVGYEWTTIDVTPRPNLDVVAAQVSVSF